MAPSSLVLKIPAAWVSPSILRSFTKLTSSRSRSSSSIPEKFDTLEKEIGALEHLLKGGNSTYASEDIRESVLIYEGGDKEYLRGMPRSGCPVITAITASIPPTTVAHANWSEAFAI